VWRAHTAYVADWAGTFEREAARYRDGEARLEDGSDERQRQLTRMGNAAWGAGVVRRYHHDGTVVDEVAVPAKNASCAVFGGAGLDELYITTARQDVPPAELARLPETGGVYRAVIHGVRGLPDTLVAD